MPELPEVENICRDIQENLKNNPVVEKINVHQRKLRQIVPVKLVSLLEGQCFKNIRRRAKYLIFEFSDGIMISHLGMTGSWSFVGSDYQKEKHDHIFIFFSNGKIMVYSDPRRFGFLDWVRAGKLNTNKWISHLGPEPFDKRNFTAKYLHKICRDRKVAIKTLLMDQKVVVGVGNIYASESLYLAGIRPATKCCRLSLARVILLVSGVREILSQAISAGGSTISDYRRTGGEKGAFQNQFRVYGRKGELCSVCNSIILAKVLTGRSSFWCPICQKP